MQNIATFLQITISILKNSNNLGKNIKNCKIEDLKNALGQYILYEKILRAKSSERTLYLAIRKDIFDGLFSQEIGQILLLDDYLTIIIFDPETEIITQWIN
ncbi:element excision factor XisH family protein [Crocosphaera sp.]|uniref:element excision factor XisH family protein n=1 Tax=Crocosphaera sp. TaxID=2729996 RepID=UPI0026230AD4|nr:element excision factor XisH family protein [Crocosphaera sp.]MDJ0580463.1 element excision factor XisH family protein [Crocosphaera sp.]